MLGLNIQDFFGSTIAIILFPIVSLIPGYIIGWTFDLFKFRKRSQIAKYIISIVLSNAVVPIFSYLVSRFLSIYSWATFLTVVAGIALIMHIILLMSANKRPSLSSFMSALTKRNSLFCCADYVSCSPFFSWLIYKLEPNYISQMSQTIIQLE